MSWLEVSSEVSSSEEEEKKRENDPFFFFLLDIYKKSAQAGFPHHKFFFGRI